MDSTKSAMNTTNGLDLAALGAMVEDIQKDPTKARLEFAVRSSWQGQTRSEATVERVALGGEEIPRDWTIRADEPTELLGSDSAPNPQELLMAAVNACMMVGYVAGASMHGITLEKLEIRTEGDLDLRGFLGLDDQVKPGYDRLRYTVTIKGDGTPEQFAEIHENVRRTSPNFFNMSQPVAMEGQLIVG